MNFGLMYQPTEGDGGPRIPWGWLFGSISAVLSTVIVAGFRLVWRGAMADIELRLTAIELEQRRARDREARRIYSERTHRPKMEVTP